jgi:hypothetical protein
MDFGAKNQSKILRKIQVKTLVYVWTYVDISSVRPQLFMVVQKTNMVATLNGESKLMLK